MLLVGRWNKIKSRQKRTKRQQKGQKRNESILSLFAVKLFTLQSVHINSEHKETKMFSPEQSNYFVIFITHKKRSFAMTTAIMFDDSMTPSVLSQFFFSANRSTFVEIKFAKSEMNKMHNWMKSMWYTQRNAWNHNKIKTSRTHRNPRTCQLELANGFSEKIFESISSVYAIFVPFDDIFKSSLRLLCVG